MTVRSSSSSSIGRVPMTRRPSSKRSDHNKIIAATTLDPASPRRRHPRQAMDFQIHASSIWSDCWRDRPHGTSFEPKQIGGYETALRCKESPPEGRAYARYSSDNQRDASIEDQLRLCTPRNKAGQSSTAIPIAQSPVRRCCVAASGTDRRCDARQIRRRARRGDGSPEPRSG